MFSAAPLRRGKFCRRKMDQTPNKLPRHPRPRWQQVSQGVPGWRVRNRSGRAARLAERVPGRIQRAQCFEGAGGAQAAVGQFLNQLEAD